MIRQVFIPTLTGCSPPSDSSRLLFALPARWGGLGIFVPTRCVSELAASRDVTEPLSQCILNHDLSFVEAVASQQARKALLRKAKPEHCSTQFAELYQQLGPSLRRAMDLATVRGASSWLTTLPLSEHGFTLHRSAFQDALALRYDWSPLRPPSLCACGTSFSVEHALSCPKGGLPSLRHNEIRDLTATLLTEVCSQVCIEPELQPVQHSDEFPLATSNTQDLARLDVAVNGFWGGRSERCFIDVRVFNPFAPSNSSSSLSSTFRKHEKIKHRAYGQRVREVEHATFTTIVLAATGGLAHEATVFYKRLASLLAKKWGDDYSVVLGWLRCCLSFSLLRSAIQCIRGARSSIGVYTRTPQSVDLVTVESHLSA